MKVLQIKYKCQYKQASTSVSGMSLNFESCNRVHSLGEVQVATSVQSYKSRLLDGQPPSRGEADYLCSEFIDTGAFSITVCFAVAMPSLTEVETGPITMSWKWKLKVRLTATCQLLIHCLYQSCVSVPPCIQSLVMSLPNQAFAYKIIATSLTNHFLFAKYQR